MKWIKYIVAAVFGIILLAAATAAILVATFDPNDYKERIAAAVKAQTGRDLVLSGEIGLSLFPWLGISVADVSLGNAPGFGDGPFARIDFAELHVTLVPLLRKELRVDRLRLDRLELNLARLADGRRNWDDLLQPSSAPTDKAGGAAVARPTLLDVAGIEITAARLAWRDAVKGEDLIVAPVDVSIGRIQSGAEVPMHISAKLVREKPALAAQTVLLTKLKLDMGAKRLSLTGLELDLGFSGEGLPEGGMQVSAGGKAEVDLDQGGVVASLRPVTFVLPGTRLKGAIEFATDEAVMFRANGSLSTEGLNPRELMAAFGTKLETADPKVLAAGKIALDFDADAQGARIEKLQARFDDTRLSGNARMTNFASPAVRFSLEGDAIDLDRYLAPELEVRAGSAGGSADTSVELPVETLRNLDLAGDLKFGRIAVKGLRLNDLRLTLTARDGLVSLKPFSAGLYEGRLDAVATLDASGRVPRYVVEPRLESVQIGEFMNELAGDRYVTGVTRVEGRLETGGVSTLALRKELNGRFAIEARDGTIKGLDLARNINTAMGQIDPRLAVHDSGDETAFTTLKATATVTNGVVSNRDLHLLAPLFQAFGKGTADLGTERVKYELVVANAPKPGETGVPKKTLPLLIEGPFHDLKYRLDLARVVEERARKQVEKEKQKVDEKLQDELQKLIR